MAALKTKPNSASVARFLASLPDERRAECRALARIMQQATGRKPRMWGANVVGFGTYDYRYASGTEGTWFLTGFAPRRQNLTLYLMAGARRFPELSAKLGKHTTGVSCVYIKRLADVDLSVLARMVKASVQETQRFNSQSRR
jgi:hypothetical protein